MPEARAGAPPAESVQVYCNMSVRAFAQMYKSGSSVEVAKVGIPGGCFSGGAL